MNASCSIWTVFCRTVLSAARNTPRCWETAHAFTTLLPAGGPAAQVVDALFENMEKEQPGYEFLTTGLLWQLIGIVLRHRLYTADSGEAPHPGGMRTR